MQKNPYHRPKKIGNYRKQNKTTTQFMNRNIAEIKNQTIDDKK